MSGISHKSNPPPHCWKRLIDPRRSHGFAFVTLSMLCRALSYCRSRCLQSSPPSLRRRRWRRTAPRSSRCPAPLRAQLTGRFWRPGCPVHLSQLRLLSVSHWGFDDRVHEGQLVVNRDVAAPLAKVFRKLYDLRFPIRHMRFADAYGPARARPADGDISGSFECRQAVPSPCTGGTASGLLVEPRVRPRDRPQSRREPVRRLRPHPRSGERALHRPLPIAPGDGDAGSRSRVSLDRLGLGRRLVGSDEGLHALLHDGPLGSPQLRAGDAESVPPRLRSAVDDCVRSSTSLDGPLPGTQRSRAAGTRCPFGRRGPEQQPAPAARHLPTWAWPHGAGEPAFLA